MRKALLAVALVLLLLELILVVSLRTQGWDSTTNSARWTFSLLAAAIPLVIAMVLLARGGRRFSLRSLLVGVALVSLFLYATVLPLLEADRGRRATRRMLALGAEVQTNNPNAEGNFYYKMLKFDPRDTATISEPPHRELPPWLIPLAGKMLKTPGDISIRGVTLSADDQISELCRSTAKFPNLEHISIVSGVRQNGMEMLSESLPGFENLIEIQIDGVSVPASFLESLAKSRIRSLWIWDQWGGKPTLSPEQLKAIGKLEHLRLLWIYRYAVTDADLTSFEQMTSLRRALFSGSAVTKAGKQRLELALPDCTFQF